MRTVRDLILRFATRRGHVGGALTGLRNVLAAQRDVSTELRFDPRDLKRHEILDRKHFLRRAFTYVAFNDIAGDYAEFGCNGAMTFRLAWSASRLVERPTKLWGFDSFEGLPEPRSAADHHPRWVAGTMSTSLPAFHDLCARHGMEPHDYEVVPGFYSTSLAGQDVRGPRRVAIAYIDCDLYSSTVEVLRYLRERIGPGTLLAFDDWFCPGPESTSGERLAAMQEFDDTGGWVLVPYQPFGWHGMSFVVEPREPTAPISGADGPR